MDTIRANHRVASETCCALDNGNTAHGACYQSSTGAFYDNSEAKMVCLTPVCLAVFLRVVHTDRRQPLPDRVGGLVHSQDTLAFTRCATWMG